MKKLRAFYFSGTGNTRYIAELLCGKLSAEYETQSCDICANKDFYPQLAQADLIMLAFPIYGSSPPYPMRRFVYKYAQALRGKEVIIAVTQYMFSGDGAASLGRTVEKFGGKVLYAEHFDMPNNLSDCKLFTIKNGDALNKTLAKADKKAEKFAKRIADGKPFRRGFNGISRAVGYYCQRKYWRKHESAKKTLLKIDTEKCIGCGICAGQCPVNNITIGGGKAAPRGECAFCYRCVNSCPKKAISLFGKSAPQTQYKGIKT